MGIFGWNLPPGVSVRDLPGNSAAEADAEAFWDNVYDQFPELPEELLARIAEWSWTKVSDAYAKGYAEGMKDNRLAAEEH